MPDRPEQIVLREVRKLRDISDGDGGLRSPA